MRGLGISSTSEVSKTENNPNLCCADCFQEWSTISTLSSRRCSSHISRLLIESWCIYSCLNVCTFFIWHIRVVRNTKLKTQKHIRQGMSSPTSPGKFRAVVNNSVKLLKILDCDELFGWGIFSTSAFWTFLRLQSAQLSPWALQVFSNTNRTQQNDKPMQVQTPTHKAGCNHRHWLSGYLRCFAALWLAGPVG